ncbi:hypothetical protein KAI04_01145 [Candidatus Pacearchaeota archaeon]|nr:hypothetical protein [Candidatus Pacearchaeota archaeon]
MGIHGENTFEIKYDEKGIAKLDFPNYYETGLGSNTAHVEKNDLRQGLDSLLEKDMSYSVFQVFINPKAREELHKYVGNHKWIDGKIGQSNYRKARKKDEYKLDFSPQLKGTYLSVLNELMNLNLRDNSFIDFSNVKEDSGGGWPTMASFLSPQTYVIKNKGDNISTFNHCVNILNENIAYEILKKKEHPQNYKMAEINILRNKNINPLIIGEEKSEFSTETLKSVVNLLMPFKVIHKSSGGCYDGDF